MTKNYAHIADALYNKPWCILPSYLHSLKKQFEAHLGTMVMPNDKPLPDDINYISANPFSNVALISIDGIIGKHLGLMETACGGVDIDDITEQLLEASINDSVKSILLYFNSPGGQVTGVNELGQLISDINTKKKCYAYTDTLCASAAYWLASQCEQVFVAPSANVGSIGVYSLYVNETEALKQAGIEVIPVYSGKFKLSGASFQTMTKEEKAMFQTDCDKIHSQFKSAVKTKRICSDNVLEGQCFTGDIAVMNGLADGTADRISEVLEYLDKKQ
jgi:protease-4